MFFGVSSSVTECFQSVTDYLQPVTELGTPKNMAVALPGMTLQPLYIFSEKRSTFPYIISAITVFKGIMIPVFQR